ncbi:MAG: biotin/lipoyl-binding protein, partial [Porticoccus sp.]|nr:biotin/lipoyl-binding protein [Porticoccus sp.]
MSSFEQIKANKNYRKAIIILVLLVLWMASGVVFTQKAGEISTEAPVDTLYRVRAKHIDAQSYLIQLRVSAQTQANRSVHVRAEVSGQVSHLPVDRGELVKAGDVICELAVEDRQFRVEQSRAEVDKATLEYEAALQLKSSGFQARTVIAEKKFELEKSRANLKRAELDFE